MRSTPVADIRPSSGEPNTVVWTPAAAIVAKNASIIKTGCHTAINVAHCQAARIHPAHRLVAHIAVEVVVASLEAQRVRAQPPALQYVEVAGAHVLHSRAVAVVAVLACVPVGVGAGSLVGLTGRKLAKQLRPVVRVHYSLYEALDTAQIID